MTHLSDFSFLQRMVSFSYLYIWYTYRVWTSDKFSCLHPRKFKQGELKSIVTLLILFMIPFQLFYDITSVKIKYEEGFTTILGHVFTKPEMMWTKADKNLVIPTEYSLCIGFSLQTGTLVLLQCFWNYLANSVAKVSFMSSKEFVFYISWTFASFIIFPVLQYNFSRDIYDPTYKEIFPEMIYGIELFIVACLGVMSHFRFRNLLKVSRNTVNSKSINAKIRYFQEVNLILSTVLFGHGTLLTILSCDGLTNKRILNLHKFSADFFICNINICAVVTWFCMILIFHPKHSSIAVYMEDEILTAEEGSETSGTSKQFNSNNSKISDTTTTYSQAQTLVLGSSQQSSDYALSKGTLFVRPLSYATATTINNDSAFQFGPLPNPPSMTSESSAGCRKNNSIRSTTPSMTTLVSQNQLTGSQKSNNGYRSTKGSMTASEVTDYFQATTLKNNVNSNTMTSILPTPTAIADFYQNRSTILQDLAVGDTSSTDERALHQGQQQFINRETIPFTSSPILSNEEWERYSSSHTRSRRNTSSSKHHYRVSMTLENSTMHYPNCNNEIQESKEYIIPSLSPDRSKNRGTLSQNKEQVNSSPPSTIRSIITNYNNEDLNEFGVAGGNTKLLLPSLTPLVSGEASVQPLEQQQSLNSSVQAFRGLEGSNVGYSTSSLLSQVPRDTSGYSIDTYDSGSREDSATLNQFMASTLEEGVPFEFLPSTRRSP